MKRFCSFIEYVEIYYILSSNQRTLIVPINTYKTILPKYISILYIFMQTNTALKYKCIKLLFSDL